MNLMYLLVCVAALEVAVQNGGGAKLVRRANAASAELEASLLGLETSTKLQELVSAGEGYNRKLIVPLQDDPGFPNKPDHRSLGTMYNHKTDTLSDAFLAPNLDFHTVNGNQNMDYMATFQSDIASQADLIDVSGSIGVQYNMIKVEGYGMYHNENKKGGLDVTLFDTGYVVKKIDTMNLEKLNAEWDSGKLLHSEARNNPAHFFKQHGMFVVKSLYYGVRASRKITITVHDEETARVIKAGAAGEIGIGPLAIKIKGDFKMTGASKLAKWKVDVRANGIGGNQTHLTDIYGDTDEEHEDFLVHFERRLRTSFQKYLTEAVADTAGNWPVLWAELTFVNSGMVKGINLPPKQFAKFEMHVMDALDEKKKLDKAKYEIRKEFHRATQILEQDGCPAPAAFLDTYEKAKASFEREIYQPRRTALVNYLANNFVYLYEHEMEELVVGGKRGWEAWRDVDLKIRELSGSGKCIMPLPRSQFKVGWLGPVVNGEPAGAPRKLYFFEGTEEPYNTRNWQDDYAVAIEGQYWNAYRHTGAKNMEIEANENIYTNGIASVKFLNLPAHRSGISYFAQFHGKCRWRAENILKYSHYDGPWKLSDGKAKMHTTDPDHDGTLTYTNGDVYVGQFQFGLRHGKGELTYADGTKETGTWNRGHLETKLTEFLRDALIPWEDRTIWTVQAKLEHVGVKTPANLRDRINDGTLQQLLRDSGRRTFHSDTLQKLRNKMSTYEFSEDADSLASPPADRASAASAV